MTRFGFFFHIVIALCFSRLRREAITWLYKYGRQSLNGLGWLRVYIINLQTFPCVGTNLQCNTKDYFVQYKKITIAFSFYFFFTYISLGIFAVRSEWKWPGIILLFLYHICESFIQNNLECSCWLEWLLLDKQKINTVSFTFHYENTPIQIHWKFDHPKMTNF